MDIEKIKSIIDDLKNIIKTEINLLDETGYIFYSTDINKIGNYDNQILSFDLNNNFLTKKEEYIYCCYNSYEGDRYIISIEDIKEDTFKIAQVIQIFLNNSIKNISRKDFIKNILLNTIAHHSLEDLCQKHGIAIDGEVQVIIIEATEKFMAKIEEILSALLPNEIIVKVKSKYFAIIKDVNDEIHEFPMLLSDTISSELFYEVKIGIGTIVNNIKDWHLSYKTAETFIEIGKVFLPNRKIYSFRNLAIPLIISKLLTHDLEEIMKEFNCNIEDLFLNNELLTTAMIFLKNNLSITDAARDLFIHRNTLIYRLNKIQDITGYDLRLFEDAVLFNIMINGYLYLKLHYNNKYNKAKGITKNN